MGLSKLLYKIYIILNKIKFQEKIKGKMSYSYANYTCTYGPFKRIWYFDIERKNSLINLPILFIARPSTLEGTKHYKVTLLDNLSKKKHKYKKTFKILKIGIPEKIRSNRQFSQNY